MRVFGLVPPGDVVGAAKEILARYEDPFLVASPRAVAGPRHALLSLRRAVRSFEARTNIAKTVHMEALLYLTGTRNIGRALELAAVSEGDPGIVLVAERPPEGWELREELIGGHFDRALFGVPPGEDPELWMIEAGALLELEKI